MQCRTVEVKLASVSDRHQPSVYGVLASSPLPSFPWLLFMMMAPQSSGSQSPLHHCQLVVWLSRANGFSHNPMPILERFMMPWMCLDCCSWKAFVNVTTWTSKSAIHRDLLNVSCQRRKPCLLNQITDMRLLWITWNIHKTAPVTHMCDHLAYPVERSTRNSKMGLIDPPEKRVPYKLVTRKGNTADLKSASLL